MSSLKVESYPTYTLMIPCCLLEIVNLGSNVLTGTITNIYGELLNIKEIDFSDNNFEGILSANIFEAVNIEKINLSGNILHGYLAPLSGYPKLMFLEELRLGRNCLFGELQTDTVVTMPKLSVLDLSYNNSNCEEKMSNREDCDYPGYDRYWCCNESDEPDEVICSREFDYSEEDIIILHQTGLWGHLPP